MGEEILMAVFQLYVYSVKNQVRTCQAEKSLDIAKSFAATHNLVEKKYFFPNTIRFLKKFYKMDIYCLP